MADTPLSILVAPDKFKGSLGAVEVSEIISDVLKMEFPDAFIIKKPIADGGDGSLEIVIHHGFTERKLHSYNALMEPTEISYGEGSIDGKKTAFLEMASICGIASISGRPLQPYFASSYGLGEVAYQLLDSDIEQIIISVGGSASTDGGLGFLAGIGATILDCDGLSVSPNLNGLARVERVNLSLVHPRVREVAWKFLVDVTNPLIGPNGAAYIFGPQKGLPPEEIESVDKTLRRWAELLRNATGKDVSQMAGAGAAGGVPSIALSIFSAEFVTGADWFSEILQIDSAINESSLVITGEGSFDSQSLMGKGPGSILLKAAERGKKRAVIAGRVEPGLEALKGVYIASLIEQAGSLSAALSEPRKWLEAATQGLANAIKDATQFP